MLELVRQLQVNGPIRGSIATTASGDIVVPCEDGSLYVLNAQAKPLWTSTQTISIDSSPAIGPRGEVVVGSRDGKVYLFQ